MANWCVTWLIDHGDMAHGCVTWLIDHGDIARWCVTWLTRGSLVCVTQPIHMEIDPPVQLSDVGSWVRISDYVGL